MGRGQLALFVCVLVSLDPAGAVAQGLEISAIPSEVVPGQHRAVTIVVRTGSDTGTDLQNLRLVCSAGRIASPHQSSPGRWTASFQPPQGNYPRVVLVLASAERGDDRVFGSALIPIRGRTELPIRTDPGARVTVHVGESSYGPVLAGRDGLARVAVEVPVGVEEAIARSVDPIGNQNERVVPLNLPDYERTLIMAPPRLDAGSSEPIAVLAVSRSGEILRDVELTVTRGGVRALVSTTHHVLFTMESPDDVGDGFVELRASTTGENGSVVTRRLDVVAGAAADILIRSNREALIPGSDQRATVRAVVTDRLGNARPSDEVELWIDDRPLEVTRDPEGGVRAVIEAPPTSAGLGILEIEARSANVRGGMELRLIGGSAQLARIEAPERVVADGRTPARIRVLLSGPTGLPASDVPDLRASAGTLIDMELGEDGWWTVSYVPRRSRLWSQDSDTIEVSRGPAQARARINLVPPAPWLTVGLYGGLQTNMRALHSGAARLEIGSRVRLARGWLEIAAFSGFSYGESSDELERGHSSLELWQIPFSAGFGYGLTIRRRLGFDVVVRGGALLLLIYERTSFQPSTERIAVAPLVEGSAGLTIRLWRGELLVRLGFAYSAATEGSGLTGNLMGLVALLGYRLFVI